MPEGPEIRRAADRIAKAVVGHPLREVFFAFPELESAQALLEGESVLGVDAHGKAMLTRFSNDLVMYSHNQLYGRWFVTRPDRPPKTNRSLRVALRTDHKDALLYSASEVDLLSTDELAAHPFLRRLGPDPLWSQTRWQEIDQRLRSKSFAGRQLGALLLDQTFVAGLGNYLRSEILFLAGLRPDRRPKDLDRSSRHKLARRVLSVTRRSYRSGGVTLSVGLERELRSQGVPRRAARFWIFARAGRPCWRCGSRIERAQHSGRRVYICASCQS